MAVRILGLASQDSPSQIIVASDRLLQPERLAAALGAPVTVHEGLVAEDQAVSASLWLLDESLKHATQLQCQTDGAAQPTWLLSELLAGDHQWVACTEPLLPIAPDAVPADDRQRVHASISRFTERRIAARLDATLCLPPLSATARSLLELRAAPFGNVQQLIAVVEKDAALAARLVGWANSAYYAAPGSVHGIQDAVARVIGFDGALSMALGLALADSVPAAPEPLARVPDYWVESLLTAATMENLALRWNHPGCPADAAYLCGLLAHFGTLILAHVFPPQHQKVRALQNANRHLYYGYCDLAVLGVTRDVLAAELLTDWALPSAVTSAVREQCVPDTAQPLAQLLRYARELLAGEGLGSYPQLPRSRLPDVLQGLDLEAVLDVLAVLREPGEELYALGGLFSGPAQSAKGG